MSVQWLKHKHRRKLAFASSAAKSGGIGVAWLAIGEA